MSNHREKDFRVPARYVVGIFAIGMTQAACLVAFTLMMAWVADTFVPAAVGRAEQVRYEQALWLTGAMAVIALLMGVLRTLEFGVSEQAGYEVVRRLRMRMYGHLLGMTPDQLRHRARGGLLLRLTGDLSMLRMWLSRGLLLGTVALIVLLTGLGVISYLNPWMGLAVILGASLTIVVSVMNGRPMRRATRVMRRRRSLVIGNIDEQLNALAVVQIGGRTRGEYQRLSRQNDSLTRALNRVAWLRARLRGLAFFGSLLITVLVLGVGLIEIRRGFNTVGDVTAALIIARFLSRPIRVLGLAHDYWHRGMVSRGKVADFLASSSRGADLPDREQLRVRRGLVELDRVSAGVLQDLTAAAEPGQLVGITGPNGGGKSTLLRVMSKLEDPDSGQVRVDGQSLSRSDPRSVFRQVGYAGPDLPLLRGSIRRNLTYADRNAELADVQRVAFALGIDDLLQNHPDGLNAWLTEGGSNISAGERQLISLGRAMVANPPLLLLDEPMTALDADAQETVRRAIGHYQGTVFLVSHDPRDLAMADVVWTIRDGQLEDVRPGRDYAPVRSARAIA